MYLQAPHQLQPRHVNIYVLLVWYFALFASASVRKHMNTHRLLAGEKQRPRNVNREFALDFSTARSRTPRDAKTIHGQHGPTH
jgi:hypothetical protein